MESSRSHRYMYNLSGAGICSLLDFRGQPHWLNIAIPGGFCYLKFLNPFSISNDIRLYTSSLVPSPFTFTTPWS